MNCSITMEPWEILKVIVLLCLLLFHKSKHIKKQKLNFPYESLHFPPLRQRKKGITDLPSRLWRNGVDCLPLCPLLLTIASSVLSLIALYAVSSGKYLEFQNVFYRKCLAFTLINKLICILTKTQCRKNVKSNFYCLWEIAEDREWPADLFSHISQCSTQQYTSRQRAHSSHKCILPEMLI